MHILAAFLLCQKSYLSAPMVRHFPDTMIRDELTFAILPNRANTSCKVSTVVV